MNFSFTRKSNISSVFSASKVYWTRVPTNCAFFHKAGAFSANKEHVNVSIVDRSTTS